MFHYISLSTDTRLPSSSALVVSLRATVDGSFVAVSTNGIIASHFVVDVGSALVPFSWAGTASTGVLGILAQPVRPTVVPSWETWSASGALVVSGLVDWWTGLLGRRSVATVGK